MTNRKDTDSLRSFVKTWGVGLTGGAATGKSTVAHMLAARGFSVIDADDLARQAVKPGTACLHAIIDHFGPSILAPDGTLNRKAMAAIVFNDPAQRQKLESITHPEIQSLFNARIVTLGLTRVQRPFFYEAALLYESGRAAQFAQVWATICSPDTQIQRLKQARKLDEASARALLSSQTPAADKSKNADVIINTDCALPDVELQVAAAVRRLPGGGL